MGAVLGTLAELGYGWTYRVLDLQHFGVPQRRRRVFIVGRAGGFCPPEILLEPESLPGDYPAREETGQEAAGFATAGTLDARQAAGGFPGTDGAASGHVVAFPLTAREGKGPASSVDSGNIVAHQCHGSNVGEMGTLRRGNGSVSSGVPFVAHTLRAEGFDASEDGTGRGTPIVPSFMASDYRQGEFEEADRARPLTTSADRTRAAPIALAFNAKQAAEDAGDTAPTLRAMPHDQSHPNAGGQVAVMAMRESGQGFWMEDDKAGTLRAEGENRPSRPSNVIGAAIPRRLTPRECERLMGWPDDWTRYGITDDGREVEMADGPRYRMCGNGVGAPVAEWIARRIIQADTHARKDKAA